MRYLLVIVGIICVTSCSNNLNKPLSPDEFKNKLTQTSGNQLVDVRTPSEFQEGHLNKALNIDVNSDDFKEKIGKLDKNKAVFVYCKAGGRSAKAASILNEMGFKEVYDLEGGYSNWVESKMSIDN